jgi:hypothetical protein
MKKKIVCSAFYQIVSPAISVKKIRAKTSTEKDGFVVCCPEKKCLFTTTF